MHYSLEIFPPKKPSAQTSLDACLASESFRGAQFISVTCGAGGDGNRDTKTLVEDVLGRGMRAVPHITCAEPRNTILSRLTESGAGSALCLRGDATPDPDGFKTVLDLIEAVRVSGDKSIFCAGYPEPHPDSLGRDADLDWMRQKRDAGADAVITQYAFDADLILRYRDELDAAAPGLKFRPGILPVRDLTGLLKFSERCGASVPDRLVHDLSSYAPLSDDFFKASTDQVSRLLEALGKEGVESVHVYVLNEDRILSDLLQTDVLTTSGESLRLAA